MYWLEEPESGFQHNHSVKQGLELIPSAALTLGGIRKAVHGLTLGRIRKAVHGLTPDSLPHCAPVVLKGPLAKQPFLFRGPGISLQALSGVWDPPPGSEHVWLIVNCHQSHD